MVFMLAVHKALVEWGLEGMRVIGEAAGLVVTLSAVGFHCIPPNLLWQSAAFAG
jgi:hypothetical protein